MGNKNNEENSQTEEDLLRDVDTNIDFSQVDRENATTPTSSGSSEEDINGGGLGSSSKITDTEEQQQQQQITSEEDNEGSTEVTHRGVQPVPQIQHQTQD